MMSKKCKLTEKWVRNVTTEWWSNKCKLTDWWVRIIIRGMSKCTLTEGWVRKNYKNG